MTASMSKSTKIATIVAKPFRPSQASVGLLIAIALVASIYVGVVGVHLYLESGQSAAPAQFDANLTWVRRPVGELTVAIPTNWTGPVGLTETESSWCLGQPEEPNAIFNVLHYASYESLIEDMDVTNLSRTKVAGQAATLYFGSVHGTPAGRRSLVVLDDPRPDGHRIGFLCFAREDLWAELTPVFDQILNSVRIGK